MIYDEKRNSCQASVFAALFMIYVGYLTKKGSRKWQDGVKKFMEKWEVYKIYVLLGAFILILAHPGWYATTAVVRTVDYLADRKSTRLNSSH